LPGTGWALRLAAMNIPRLYVSVKQLSEVLDRRQDGVR